MPATAKILEFTRDDGAVILIRVARDPKRDREYDDQPMPPDVAQALLDLIAPSNQGEVTE